MEVVRSHEGVEARPCPVGVQRGVREVVPCPLAPLRRHHRQGVPSYVEACHQEGHPSCEEEAVVHRGVREGHPLGPSWGRKAAVLP